MSDAVQTSPPTSSTASPETRQRSQPMPHLAGLAAPRIAVLGFSIEVFEALDRAGVPFVAVVPPEFEAYMNEHDMPAVPWDFEKRNEQSGELAVTLKERGVTVAVPLYEETVQWSGGLNALFRDDPRLFNRSLLFRDKSMMKRKAQMSGLRVGVFEEAENREDVSRFFKRVNKALLKLDGETDDPVHLKPFSAAGCLGHRVIRSEEDAAKLTDDQFPCLLESHLDGQEFSCEVFIHDKKIRFLNITEYVHLGHSNFIPCGPVLEAMRPRIQEACEQLIEAFGIEYGMIHPEWFVSQDKLNFGEVAARIPGGHIFNLIERAYGFDPYAAFALCSDPETPESVLEEFFPATNAHEGYAGSLMVYPRQKVVTKVSVPDELVEHPFYEKHNLFVPVTPKVAERVAYGDHYGTIFFFGDDPIRMGEALQRFEDMDYYV